MLKLHVRLGVVLALSFCLLPLGASFAAQKGGEAELSAASEDEGVVKDKDVLDPVEERIKIMRERVSMTLDQSGVFDAMATIMRNNRDVLKSMMQSRQDVLRKMDADEDVRSYVRLWEAYLGGLKDLSSRFVSFYNMLDKEQKRAVNLVFGEYSKKKQIWIEPSPDLSLTASAAAAPPQTQDVFDPVEERVKAMRERVVGIGRSDLYRQIDSIAMSWRYNHESFEFRVRSREDNLKRMPADVEVRSYVELREVSVRDLKDVSMLFDAFYNMLEEEQKKAAVNAIFEEYREKKLIWIEPYLDPVPAASPDAVLKIDAPTK